MEIIRYTGTNQSKKWGMAAREKGRKLVQWENPKTTSTELQHKTSASSAMPSLPAPLLTASAHPGSSSVAHQGCTPRHLSLWERAIPWACCWDTTH